MLLAWAGAPSRERLGCDRAGMGWRLVSLAGFCGGYARKGMCPELCQNPFHGQRSHSTQAAGWHSPAG